MDDRWRDSYDTWKLQSPYDDWEEDPRENCDHEEYEVDWEGRAEFIAAANDAITSSEAA